MPPRLHCTNRFRPSLFLVSRPTSLQLPPLLPFLYPPSSRSSSILTKLHDNPGAIKHRQRKGRGPSSGRGQKSGRGHTGQKSRSGYKLPKDFEGGQTRQAITNPVGVFKNHWAKDYTTLNLGKVVNFIAQGRINPAYPITMRELQQSRCVSNVKDGVKLLASGHETLPSLPHPLNIIVSRASAQAIEMVEKGGGSVHTRYYTQFAARQILKGRMDPVNSLQSEFPEEVARAAGKEMRDVGEGRKKYLYRLPDPVHRKEIEYYRDPAHRGYLAHLVRDGESPSLFWKVPKVVEKGAQMERKVKKTLAENRIF